MRIAIASGKGGTGKTLVSSNVAVSLARLGQRVCYVDCDVEEPNGHLFLKPALEGQEAVTVGVPEVDMARCTGCGRCGSLCQYSAILCLPGQVMTFPELCHACGGCTRICPEAAICEVPRQVGTVSWGQRDGLGFVQGRLQIGAVQSPTVIAATKARAEAQTLQILDCPPGTSCPVVEAVRGADFVVLVTEPTPFGLHDLTLAVALLRELGGPFGVVINRSDIGDARVRDYCKQEAIDVLMEIPNDRRVAEVYAEGGLLVETLPAYERDFAALGQAIRQRISRPGARRA